MVNKLVFKSALNIFTRPGGVNLTKPGESLNKKCTLIRGAGIGPEIIGSVERVFCELKVPVVFEKKENFQCISEANFDELKKNEYIFMGPIKKMTPESKGISRATQMYRHLGLFAQVVPVVSIPGLEGARHKNVNTVIIRENTEGEYSGIEHEVYPGVIESIKVTTMEASLKVANYGFEFASLTGRKKVTAVHKANIMKICDGLFLEACREVAKKYPHLQYEEMIVDNASMQLVKSPQQFDVMIMPNLYGSIIQNIAMGVTGNIGNTPGALVGNTISIYGQGTRHRGFDIAGQNIVNPTGGLLSSVMMLKNMNLSVFADAIMQGVLDTIAQGKTLTRDMQGTATTTQYTDQVILNSQKYL